MAEQIDTSAKWYVQARRDLKRQHTRESRHKVRAMLRHGEYDDAQDMDVRDGKYEGWLS